MIIDSPKVKSNQTPKRTKPEEPEDCEPKKVWLIRHWKFINTLQKGIKERASWDFPVVQWLRQPTPNAGLDP